MPRHKCRIAKPKPLNPKRRKKAVKGPELVSNCDHCGRVLRTCARTVGSAVLANIDGVIAGEIEGKWMFFCSKACAIKESGDRAGKWACGSDSWNKS